MPFVPVVDAAMTLPASMYRDPAVYERERAAIFGREWIAFARAEQLAKPGAGVAGVVAGVYEQGRLSPRHEAGVHQFQQLVRTALEQPASEQS